MFIESCFSLLSAFSLPSSYHICYCIWVLRGVVHLQLPPRVHGSLWRAGPVLLKPFPPDICVPIGQHTVQDRPGKGPIAEPEVSRPDARVEPRCDAASTVDDGVDLIPGLHQLLKKANYLLEGRLSGFYIVAFVEDVFHKPRSDQLPRPPDNVGLETLHIINGAAKSVSSRSNNNTNM